MPLILDDIMNADCDIYMYTGTIKRMFKNCPKSDGWFGCFFSPDGQPDDIRITGTVPKHQIAELKEGNKFNLVAKESQNKQFGGYEIKFMELVPSYEHLGKILSGIKGIGKATIGKIITNFGEDSIEIIKNQPDELINLGISASKISMMQACLNKSINTERLRLIAAVPDLPITVIDSVFQESDKSLSDTVDEFLTLLSLAPYSLITKYSEITFPMIDGIALDNGVSPDDVTRIGAVMAYVLGAHYRASTFIDTTKELNQFIDDACSVANKALSSFITSQYVRQVYNDMFVNQTVQAPDNMLLDGTRLYEKEKYLTERGVGIAVATLVKERPVITTTPGQINRYIDDFEKIEGVTLDSFQRNAVFVAIENRISCITGGPGRGKSSVAKCIAYVFNRIAASQGKARIVHLCAPTGKACNRLAEATNKTGIRTIDSIYRTWSFMKDSNNKKAKAWMESYEDTLVIVDESSMIDLLKALNAFKVFGNCQICFMGDCDQLPSIGYGQFFKDLYTNPNVASAKLQINHRSTGIIVSNADLLNQGVHIENMQLTQDNTFSFYDYKDDGLSAANHIMKDFYDVVYDANVDKLRKNLIESCILCPMSKGSGGVAWINATLQSRLNASGTDIPELSYKRKDIAITPKVGDRVIYMVNDAAAEYRYVSGPNVGDYGTGISNGDCGFIIDYDNGSGFDPASIKLITDDGRLYDMNMVDCDKSIELAYAMSIHKSQGSEYQNVFISVQPELCHTPKGFACKNLMYTAITRAKTHCAMYGSAVAMNLCIDTPIDTRNSYLNAIINANI